MDSCLNCLRLHLAKANSLIEEWLNGYEGHDWFAMAEMALAEWHCGNEHAQLRMNIRGERKAFEDDRKMLPNLLDLIVHVNLMEKEQEFVARNGTEGEDKESGRAEGGV